MTSSSKMGRQSSLCHGPIADLEAHLPDEWWRTLFNALYVKTDGDLVENNDTTRMEVDLIESLSGIDRGSAILDLCCGQGRHVIELAARGYTNVTGVDRSRYLIRLARKRAKAAGLNISFREGDARATRLHKAQFDCLTIMGNSFGYFSNSDEDEKVLLAAGKLLKPSGVLVLDVADGAWLMDHFEPRSWEWIDEHHFVCRERSLAADGERLISREVITHDEKGVIADQFYAERLYTVDRISSVLKAAGFRDIRHNGVIESYSERNQDLGMMSHRMVLTADAPRASARAKPQPNRALSLAVLLGDPRLPDLVKPDGKFNLEDLETVARLKEALDTLPSFDIQYLDHHAMLERDLAAKPLDLIFNLCDEGFNNDPFKELHIPALLDRHDIAYTGAAPQCLALCYDKSVVRAIAAQLDIPIPLESYMRASDQGATIPAVFPALVKPNFGDSSEGITKDSVVNNTSELLICLEKLRCDFPERPVLVQEYLEGAEYSVGLIGNPVEGLQALPLLEVDYSQLDPSLPKILGYDSKWLPESPYWTGIKYRNSTLDEQSQTKLINHSIRLFERLGCKDYARFDFRADGSGTIKLLEVNPNPGWCWDGKFNLMAEFAGMEYRDLLAAILDAAIVRNNLLAGLSAPALPSKPKSKRLNKRPIRRLSAAHIAH